LSSNNTQIII